MTDKPLDLLLAPRLGVGFVERAGHRKIAVNFPDEVFDRIKAHAVKDRKSISETVVSLCRCGLLDLQESDALEPTSTPTLVPTRVPYE